MNLEGNVSKSVAGRPEGKPFVFNDGPPFATGLPHYGHLLAGTIKDIVPRYWTMKVRDGSSNFRNVPGAEVPLVEFQTWRAGVTFSVRRTW